MILGFIANKLSPELTDKNAEVMVTISVAYGSYILASALNFSGIVAVAILGLYMGRCRQETSSKDSKNALMLGFWNVAAFIANTVAFVFIGLASEVPYLLRYAPLIGLCFVAVLVARYVSVESVLLAASRFIGSIPKSWRNTVFLGGIRGAVSASLALALPESPFKGVIVAVTLGVILLSLVVQTRALSYYVSKALR